MNSPKILSLSLLSAGIALSLASARADDPSSPPVPPPAPAGSATTPADGTTPPPAHHRRMRPAFVLGELTEKLNLTPDEQKTVGSIISDCDGQLKTLREDDTVAREDKRAKMKSIVEATRGQIRAVLTPAQQATFDAMPRGEHGGGQHAAPTPPPTT
jgi:hypothetical protein